MPVVGKGSGALLLFLRLLMYRGYIKLYRKLIDSEIIEHPGALQLFIYLSITANREPKNWRGIDIKRGQLITSRISLAQVLRQKTTSIYKRLKWLSSRGMISLSSNNKNTLVTICNYDRYQSQEIDGEQRGNIKVTTPVTTREHQSNTTKELREVREVKNNTNTPQTLPGFDVFWKLYPKKVGKGAAIKAWKKVKTPIETLELIKIALEWQKETDQWSREGGQFIPHPSTYLNQGRWMDEKTDDQDDTYDKAAAIRKKYGFE